MASAVDDFNRITWSGDAEERLIELHQVSEETTTLFEKAIKECRLRRVPWIRIERLCAQKIPTWARRQIEKSFNDS